MCKIGARQGLEVTEPQIIPMEPRHRESATEALAEAFIDDPITVFIKPEQDRRRRWSDWWWSTLLGYGMRWGVVDTDSSGRSAAVWFPPGQTTMTVRRMVRTAYLQTPFRMGLRGSMRSGRMGEALDKARRRQAPKDHWYLQAIGVHPDLQGTGVGSALLNAGHARADESGSPCYLETVTQGNIDFYSRRGYEIGECVDLPGLTLTTMMRDAGARAAGQV